MTKYDINTVCVQGGYHPQPGDPRITPIVQSTTYQYDDADQVGELFDLAREGHMYSRISNPTVAVLEEKIAALEGGVGAMATSSGQSATLLAILTICSAGDHLIAMNNLYGGTYTLLSSTIEKFGIKTTFIPLNDTEALKDAVRPETKLVFGETIGNPGVDVLDIEKVSQAAHEVGLPLIVDNTFATPALCRPLEHGADVVLHSTTKYLDGHATSVGGIIVDGGKFPWTEEKFSALTAPDPNYHGLSYTETFGNAAYIVRCRVVFLRDLGTTMSPFNAFLTNLGVETLALRMERHSENAQKVAEFLQDHPCVEKVNYPGFGQVNGEALRDKYLPQGSGGIIALTIKGGAEAAKKWINALELTTLVVHVGDIRSHALHPASMTHRQLSESALKEGGITPGLVRFSVGIEKIDDILEDLKNAFDAISSCDR